MKKSVPMLAVSALALPFTNFLDANKTMLSMHHLPKIILYYLCAAAVLVVAFRILRLTQFFDQRATRLDFALAFLVLWTFLFEIIMDQIGRALSLFGAIAFVTYTMTGLMLCVD